MGYPGGWRQACGTCDRFAGAAVDARLGLRPDPRLPCSSSRISSPPASRPGPRSAAPPSGGATSPTSGRRAGSRSRAGSTCSTTSRATAPIRHALFDGALRAHNYSYPPPTLLYTWAFGLLPYPVAFLSWLASDRGRLRLRRPALSSRRRPSGLAGAGRAGDPAQRLGRPLRPSDRRPVARRLPPSSPPAGPRRSSDRADAGQAAPRHPRAPDPRPPRRVAGLRRRRRHRRRASSPFPRWPSARSCGAPGWRHGRRSDARWSTMSAPIS